MARMKELEAENSRLRKMYVEEKLKAEIVSEALAKVRPSRRREMAKHAVNTRSVSIRLACQGSLGGTVYQHPLLRHSLWQGEDVKFRYDVLLCPTTPCIAWPVDQLGSARIGDVPVEARGHTIFTAFANHAVVPAISLRAAQGMRICR